jgi:L-rhamnose-H+ transport protein
VGDVIAFRKRTRVDLLCRESKGGWMHSSIGWGIAVVVVAAIFNGSFAAPMKRMSAWQWENSWLLFAFSGLVVFPWIVAWVTVPDLVHVYSGASLATLIRVVLFGVAWGMGATLFGLGISRVGMALGFALILGITASFGSLFPLLILHPEQLSDRRGLGLILGTIVMTIGLIFLARAGQIRERDLSQTSSGSGFTVGLVICVLSGIFSSMLNFSFLFGDELRLRALQTGTSAIMAANPIWALTVTGGFVANLVYCVYLLNRNRTWGVYGEHSSAAYWLLGISTGLLWFSGTALYGMGAAELGTLGGIIGWPIFMTLDIIVALFWGAVSGEWKGASRRALTYCWIGIGILLVSIGVISAANTV